MKRQISPSKSTIANQCPLSGGKSVFQARSLLALTGDLKRYNDRDICGAAGIQIRQQMPINKTVNNSAVLYPNPTSESVTLEFDIETEHELHFQLFNAIGTQLNMIKLSGNRGKELIDTSHLSPGVYHFRITARNTAVIFGKLVIVR